MNRTEAKKNGLCEMVVGGEENLRWRLMEESSEESIPMR
jgi:hypothetical protein